MKFNAPTKPTFVPVTITIETEEEFMLFYRLMGGMKGDIKDKFCDTFGLYSALDKYLPNVSGLHPEKYPNITMNLRD